MKRIYYGNEIYMGHYPYVNARARFTATRGDRGGHVKAPMSTAIRPLVTSPLSL